MSERVRLPETLLSCLAVMVAAWPLTTLLQAGTWPRDVALLVLLQAGVGTAGRALRLPPAASAAAQAAAVVVVGLVALVPEARSPAGWGRLPDTLGDLVAQAGATLTGSQVPARVTPGLTLLLAVGLGLLAVLVDLLAVGLRMPTAAGLPLLAVFLFSTSNTGAALSPVFFVSAALAWLALVRREGVAHRRRWASTDSWARTPEASGAGTLPATATGAALTVLALGAAVVVPTWLPHLPPRYLVDGLGRGSRDGQVVGFSESLDLAADLRSDDDTAVLRYKTTDPEPPPLKVMTSSRYAAGSWRADRPRAAETGRDGAALPLPEGLDRRNATAQHSLNLVGPGLQAPFLAAPWPVSTADLEGGPWTYDPGEALVRTRSRVQRYSITYRRIAPLARPRTDSLPSDLDPQTRSIDPASAAAVRGAVAQALQGTSHGSDFEKAVAVQRWLRDPTRFTYDLRPGLEAGGTGTDMITAFLRTRRGYCTHFATVMVMMARAEGIPARMAAGFLPGSREGEDWTVRARDAHAWPELYFPGLGWTRFEPTPSSRAGAAPEYTTGTPTDEVTASPTDGRAEPTDPAEQPTASDAAPAPAPAAAGPAGGQARSRAPLLARLAPALLGVLLLAAAAAVVPLAARRRRTVPLRTAKDVRARTEAHWRAMELDLHDLGVPMAEGRSPRQLAAHYERLVSLEEPDRAALERSARALELARYAPPQEPISSIGADTGRLVQLVRERADPLTRARAVLMPRSGREVLREQAGRLLAWPGRRREPGTGAG